jgi:hypothetical protein
MAFQFNGTNQYLSTSAPVTAAPLTMACWVYKTDVTAGGFALMSLSDEGASSDNIDLSHQNATNRIRAGSQFNAGTLETAVTTSGMTNNTWHHACGVWESASSRKAYIDAANDGTNSVSVTPVGIQKLFIGARFFGSLGGYINGRIAECGIWNVALTAAEIASLAKGMTCDKVRPQSLVFYAPLVRDLIDYKGGLTITNNNTATVANHPRVYA